MPPSSTSGPRGARPPRARRIRRYNVAGVLQMSESGALETAEMLTRLAGRAVNNDTIRSTVPPVRKAITRLFDEHGEGKWKPTSEETTREKAAKGLRVEPMRATDKLYESLTRDKAKGGFVRVSGRGTKISIGSRLVEGVMQKRAGRDAVLIDDQGERDVVDALRHALLDNL